ncbi:ABC transporter ATP-binding protein [uncultured Pseudoflavonifractor sp.]|uniref:ABC transporter ATP-binding protein n=1 Tax=uncultured Pseudoflavonifractor sp. TaxID=1221379 RepID=UPI0025DA30A3|nr:ABC transporter ATP-binding protein [uncultured Pseudoflavonifractor sp.]
MINAIEVRGLCKDYGDFQLRDVDLTLPGGSILGLIGENGAGKSTTIKAILGLIRRNGGSIRIFGREILGDDPSYKEDIGVVLDEASFHDPLKVPQVGRVLSGVYRDWDSARFHAAVQRFRRPRDQESKQLSRGMKQKLSIATALSHHPRLLILDEATSGLDPVVRDELLDEFLAFIQDEDHAVLISSHITSDLEKAADYVTYLHRGRVALQGAKDELLETYGRLVCSRADLQKIDPALLLGTRVNQFGCEALVKDRRAFQRRCPGLTVDPVSLEEIMVFTVRGDGK